MRLNPKNGVMRGFTLIEIMIVLAIFVLLTGGAVVGFGGQTARFRLHHAVRSVVSDLRWARHLAIKEGVPIRIVLDPDEESYWIERGSEPEVPLQGIRNLKERGMGYGDIDLVSSTGGTRITFQPSGITTNWTTITLRNAQGDERRITVILTGRVRIL